MSFYERRAVEQMQTRQFISEVWTNLTCSVGTSEILLIIPLNAAFYSRSTFSQGEYSITQLDITFSSI